MTGQWIISYLSTPAGGPFRFIGPFPSEKRARAVARVLVLRVGGVAFVEPLIPAEATDRLTRPRPRSRR